MTHEPIISFILPFLALCDKQKKLQNTGKSAGFSCRKLKKEDVRWIALFRSDFRFVAEFFVKQRRDPGYTPTEIEIQHVDEVLKLLSVFTGDERFLDLINRTTEESEIERGEKKVSSDRSTSASAFATNRTDFKYCPKHGQI